MPFFLKHCLNLKKKKHKRKQRRTDIVKSVTDITNAVPNEEVCQECLPNSSASNISEDGPLQESFHMTEDIDNQSLNVDNNNTSISEYLSEENGDMVALSAVSVDSRGNECLEIDTEKETSENDDIKDTDNRLTKTMSESTAVLKIYRGSEIEAKDDEIVKNNSGSHILETNDLGNSIEAEKNTILLNDILSNKDGEVTSQDNVGIDLCGNKDAVKDANTENENSLVESLKETDNGFAEMPPVVNVSYVNAIDEKKSEVSKTYLNQVNKEDDYDRSIIAKISKIMCDVNVNSNVFEKIEELRRLYINGGKNENVIENICQNTEESKLVNELSTVLSKHDNSLEQPFQGNELIGGNVLDESLQSSFISDNIGICAGDQSHKENKPELKNILCKSYDDSIVEHNKSNVSEANVTELSVENCKYSESKHEAEDSATCQFIQTAESGIDGDVIEEKFLTSNNPEETVPFQFIPTAESEKAVDGIEENFLPSNNPEETVSCQFITIAKSGKIGDGIGGNFLSSNNPECFENRSILFNADFDECISPKIIKNLCESNESDNQELETIKICIHVDRIDVDNVENKLVTSDINPDQYIHENCSNNLKVMHEVSSFSEEIEECFNLEKSFEDSSFDEVENTKYIRADSETITKNSLKENLIVKNVSQNDSLPQTLGDTDIILNRIQVSSEDIDDCNGNGIKQMDNKNDSAYNFELLEMGSKDNNQNDTCSENFHEYNQAHYKSVDWSGEETFNLLHKVAALENSDAYDYSNIKAKKDNLPACVTKGYGKPPLDTIEDNRSELNNVENNKLLQIKECINPIHEKGPVYDNGDNSFEVEDHLDLNECSRLNVAVELNNEETSAENILKCTEIFDKNMTELKSSKNTELRCSVDEEITSHEYSSIKAKLVSFLEKSLFEDGIRTRSDDEKEKNSECKLKEEYEPCKDIDENIYPEDNVQNSNHVESSADVSCCKGINSFYSVDHFNFKEYPSKIFSRARRVYSDFLQYNDKYDKYSHVENYSVDSRSAEYSNHCYDGNIHFSEKILEEKVKKETSTGDAKHIFDKSQNFNKSEGSIKDMIEAESLCRTSHDSEGDSLDLREVCFSSDPLLECKVLKKCSNISFTSESSESSLLSQSGDEILKDLSLKESKSFILNANEDNDHNEKAIERSDLFKANDELRSSDVRKTQENQKYAIENEPILTINIIPRYPYQTKQFISVNNESDIKDRESLPPGNPFGIKIKDNYGKRTLASDQNKKGSRHFHMFNQNDDYRSFENNSKILDEIEIRRRESINIFNKKKIEALSDMKPTARILPIAQSENYKNNSSNACSKQKKRSPLSNLQPKLHQGRGTYFDELTSPILLRRNKITNKNETLHHSANAPESLLKENKVLRHSNESLNECSSQTSEQMTPARKRILDISRDIRSRKYPFSMDGKSYTINARNQIIPYKSKSPGKDLAAYLAKDKIRRNKEDKKYNHTKGHFMLHFPGKKEYAQSHVAEYEIQNKLKNCAISPDNLNKKFDGTFRRYAGRGRTNSDLISYKRSLEWLRDAGIVGNVLTAEEANNAFKCTAGVKVTLNKGDYRRYLKKLARLKRLNYNDVYERLSKASECSKFRYIA